MTAQKHMPTRIWACLEGPMVGMFVSGGYTADWPKYVRADVADETLEALKELVSANEAVQLVLCDGPEVPGFDPTALGKAQQRVTAAETVARAAIARAESHPNG